MINRLIFHDRVSARNWWGVIFSTAGVLLLLLHGNLSNAEGLKGFSQGDLWAMGSALSWAVYCSLLRNKDRRIPANAFVAVSSLLGALILLPVVIFWLWLHPATSFAAYHDIAFLTGLAYLVIFPRGWPTCSGIKASRLLARLAVRFIPILFRFPAAY